MASALIESLRADLTALHDIGVIDKATTREFDTICPPPMLEISVANIKQLRK